MSLSNSLSEGGDPPKLNIRSVYYHALSPEERKKYDAYLTPEKRAEYKRLAELADQDKEWATAEADRLHEEAMRHGASPRRARFVLLRERNRQGLSDADMMARSGLDAAALVSMKEHDAKPSIETMEAYAKALGKRLLIVLADAEGNGDEPATP
jgi:hypothetical protein